MKAERIRCGLEPRINAHSKAWGRGADEVLSARLLLVRAQNSNASDPWEWQGLPQVHAGRLTVCRKCPSQCPSTHLQDDHSLRRPPYRESLTGLLVQCCIISYCVSSTGCCSVWAHGSLVSALCYRVCHFIVPCHLSLVKTKAVQVVTSKHLPSLVVT